MVHCIRLCYTALLVTPALAWFWESPEEPLLGKGKDDRTPGPDDKAAAAWRPLVYDVEPIVVNTTNGTKLQDPAHVRRAKELFSRPLNRTEYFERDWNWIRCRTSFSTRFDIGGSWAGPHGAYWRRVLAEHCGIINWQHVYTNHEDWGDAMVRFETLGKLLTSCTQTTVVQWAKVIVREQMQAMGRELYIWDCQDWEHDDNYGSERDRTVWRDAEGWLKVEDIDPEEEKMKHKHADAGKDE